MTAKRRRFSTAERERAVLGWRASGESAAAYSVRTGYGESSLWRWAQQVDDRTRGAAQPKGRSSGDKQASAAFAAVRVLTQDPGDRASRAGLMCELDGPGGVRLRVFTGADAETVRLLVETVLGGGAC